MGYHHSFNLYYTLDLLETALRQLPNIDYFGQERLTEIELPNGNCISLPFGNDFGENRVRLVGGEKCVELDTLLIFSADEEIREYYMKSSFRDSTPALGKPTIIGSIYLYITMGNRFGVISFVAASSSISWLFLYSRSIQDTFISFMNLTGALFGCIKTSDDYRSLMEPNQPIDIDTSDIEIDFHPYYDVDRFVDRYVAVFTR
jgi:hypothetical protein